MKQYDHKDRSQSYRRRIQEYKRYEMCCTWRKDFDNASGRIIQSEYCMLQIRGEIEFAAFVIMITRKNQHAKLGYCRTFLFSRMYCTCEDSENNHWHNTPNIIMVANIYSYQQMIITLASHWFCPACDKNAQQKHVWRAWIGMLRNLGLFLYKNGRYNKDTGDKTKWNRIGYGRGRSDC